MSRQDNSDPLPYVQVDRAVKPKAVLLANALGVSTQHALGSLVEWWELCGDPRELEAICAATPDGEEPAVVLEGHDASLRFKLASGRDVEPVVLVRLGLLEPRLQGFRVRGMSRYFEPIEKRLRAREVARLGGLASAASRLRATGSAQPVGGKGFEGRSDAGSTVAQAEPNREPKRNRTDNRTKTEPTTEAEPKPSGQRSAVSGQLFEKLHVEQARPLALEERLTDDEFSVFEHWRVTLVHPRAKATPDRKRLIAKWLKVYGYLELQAAITGITRSPFHMGENDRHTRYDDLEVIFKDASNIEKFMSLAPEVSRVA